MLQLVLAFLELEYDTPEMNIFNLTSDGEFDDGGGGLIFICEIYLHRKI